MRQVIQLFCYYISFIMNKSNEFTELNQSGGVEDWQQTPSYTILNLLKYRTSVLPTSHLILFR